MEFYLFEVVFHRLIVVDIDRCEDQHSFLNDLYLIVVVLIVGNVVWFVLIHFVVVFEVVGFVIVVGVNGKVQFDEFVFPFGQLRDHFGF